MWQESRWRILDCVSMPRGLVIWRFTCSFCDLTATFAVLVEAGETPVKLAGVIAANYGIIGVILIVLISSYIWFHRDSLHRKRNSDVQWEASIHHSIQWEASIHHSIQWEASIHHSIQWEASIRHRLEYCDASQTNSVERY